MVASSHCCSVVMAPDPQVPDVTRAYDGASYRPAGHALHDVVPAPRVVKPPPPQLSHCNLPAALLNLPVGQSVHTASAALVAPLGPKRPAAHGIPPAHDVRFSAAAAANVPLAQPVHAATGHTHR